MLVSSRLVGHKNCVITVGVRFAHISLEAPVAKEPKLPPEQLDNPNFIQKIVLRFKGIPLNGELGPPATLFDDMEKKADFELCSVPKDFKEFPERDLVNFPYPEHPKYRPKVRFLFIPAHWFTGIEKITGTSGPFLTFFGFVAFMANKGYLQIDQDGAKLIFLILPWYLIIRYGFGYKAENLFHGKWKKTIDMRKEYIKSELKEAEDFRKFSKEQTSSLVAVQENFPTIFRENLALQLEATYRKNVDYAWSELKRRLDYLQEVEQTKARFAKEILFKSITEGVRKRIETNENGIRDKYMDQCINQLKTLSK